MSIEGEPVPEPRRTRRSDARAALSAAAPILFLPPALSLADREWTLFGVPSLVVYIFAVWLCGIVLIARTNRRRREPQG